MSVVEFDRNWLSFEAGWSELHSLKFVLPAWIVCHECDENLTPHRMAEWVEYGVRAYATVGVSTVDLVHVSRDSVVEHGVPSLRPAWRSREENTAGVRTQCPFKRPLHD